MLILPGQLRALITAMARGLTWGLPVTGRELDVWRASATKIPNPEIRRDALSALDSKRGHAAGAGLFATLPRRRDRNLLRLLVAYETIWDFLDTTSERAPAERNGRQLHLALSDALDPDGPRSDYYRYHPWEEGGYLADLVIACRACCLALPGHHQARPALILEARRSQVLALNHEVEPAHRDMLLQNWAKTEAPVAPELAWYELSGAASASLTIHALLAVAVEPSRCGAANISRVLDAYNPWISAATTMLDSYVDQLEDADSGDHSYLAHYPTIQIAVARTRWLIQQSIKRAQALPDGASHTVIVAAMVAMYLSKDSARDPRLRRASHNLARAGGLLTCLLIPVLRLWRIAYGQRDA